MNSFSSDATVAVLGPSMSILERIPNRREDETRVTRNSIAVRSVSEGLVESRNERLGGAEQAGNSRIGAPDVLGQLARQIRDLETSGRPQGSILSSGCEAIDRLLPNRGYSAGSMIEVVHESRGSGCMSIALAMAKSALGQGKYLVVVDRDRRFYPPAIQRLGIPLERMVVLHPATEGDAVWGMDQALRSSAVGAVVSTLHRLDDRVARRLQLATEQGGGLGILLRDPYTARLQTSWADVQWRVRSVPLNSGVAVGAAGRVRWFDMNLTRVAGGRRGAHLRIGLGPDGGWVEAMEVEGTQTNRGLNEPREGAMYLAAQLAKPTNRRREMAG